MKLDPKLELFRGRVSLSILLLLETSPEMSSCRQKNTRKHEDVINLNSRIPPPQISKHCLHIILARGPGERSGNCMCAQL